MNGGLAFGLLVFFLVILVCFPFLTMWFVNTVFLANIPNATLLAYSFGTSAY